LEPQALFGHAVKRVIRERNHLLFDLPRIIFSFCLATCLRRLSKRLKNSPACWCTAWNAMPTWDT
jgi:hypothetical protein